MEIAKLSEIESFADADILVIRNCAVMVYTWSPIAYLS